MDQLNFTLSQEEILEVLQSDQSSAFRLLLQNSLNTF